MCHAGTIAVHIVCLHGMPSLSTLNTTVSIVHDMLPWCGTDPDLGCDRMLNRSSPHAPVVSMKDGACEGQQQLLLVTLSVWVMCLSLRWPRRLSGRGT
jgi:hypothetical protein